MSGVDLFNRPSTADDGRRNAGDFYETPQWMTAALLRHHPIAMGTQARPTRILEPCAGDGAIARVLLQTGRCSVLTNDIDTRHAADLHYDATGGELWADPATREIEWVISNLPFNVAFPILEQAWILARLGVALLLRKTFTEPTRERGGWLSVHPPTHQVCLPRHSFRGKGTDSVATDWFVWWKGDPDLYGVDPIIVDHLAKTRSVK